MLTSRDRADINGEIERSEFPRQASVEALRIVQGRYGWVSDEHIREMAPMLGMTEEELDAVATFYSFIFRRPVGRHVILVCDAVSCWVMGYEELLRGLEQRLGICAGQTTPDGRFTLLPASCLGACDRAPALMIDRDLHVELDCGKLDAILEQYR
jgi:NADH-quinone oxidoreductase subunit E